ncbi:MAG: DEAD/DEAH box helicase [Alphaproteobacteria bacterium]|nr:DEAD/DEAH box helicase [Alphaproteobacteria bacterium]
MLFSELGLKPEILAALEERGYKEPTPIQELAIPYVLMGRDVLGCAQTGTGKTAGFALPMIEILSSGKAKARMPRSIILEPTRELAAQVAENFNYYGKGLNLSVALLTGGQGMEDQIKKLERGVDVLIVTPGRMLDLYERGNVMLHDIKIFVIDEADRMLDMGFIPDIEKIAGILPKIRQTLFFSATMPAEIKKLADKFLMNPKEVSVSAPATTASTVEQSIVRLGFKQKREALRTLLKQHEFKSAFVFCNRKKDINILVESLQRHGFSAAGLHGDMVQTKRNEALDKFKKGEIALLICSDVAARGLDIKGVDAVFNFDVPFDADSYVHRIGRTGRAGADGKAFTFVTSDDDKLLANIVALIKKEIPEVKVEGLTEQGSDTPHPHFKSRHERGESRTTNRGDNRGERRESRPERNRDRYKGERNGRSGQNHERGQEQPSDNADSNVVGFGDDLPAFLRGTRQKMTSLAKEKIV